MYEFQTEYDTIIGQFNLLVAHTAFYHNWIILESYRVRLVHLKAVYSLQHKEILWKKYTFKK